MESWAAHFFAFVSSSTGLTEKFLKSPEFLRYTHSEVLGFLKSNPVGVDESDLFNALVTWAKGKCSEGVAGTVPQTIMDLKSKTAPAGADDLMGQIRIAVLTQNQWLEICKTKEAALLPLTMLQKALFDEYFDASEAEKRRMQKFPQMVEFNFKGRGQERGPTVAIPLLNSESITAVNQEGTKRKRGRPRSTMARSDTDTAGLAAAFKIRTKVSARKSAGGKAPRKRLPTKAYPKSAINRVASSVDRTTSPSQDEPRRKRYAVEYEPYKKPLDYKHALDPDLVYSSSDEEGMSTVQSVICDVLDDTTALTHPEPSPESDVNIATNGVAERPTHLKMEASAIP